MDGWAYINFGWRNVQQPKNTLHLWSDLQKLTIDFQYLSYFILHIFRSYLPFFLSFYLFIQKKVLNKMNRRSKIFWRYFLSAKVFFFGWTNKQTSLKNWENGNLVEKRHQPKKKAANEILWKPLQFVSFIYFISASSNFWRVARSTQLFVSFYLWFCLRISKKKRHKENDTLRTQPFDYFCSKKNHRNMLIGCFINSHFERT